MLKRTIFNYNLLPLFRSARIANYIFNYVFTKSLPPDELYRNIEKLFDEVLINEGRDSFRCSELIGTINQNKISKKYLSKSFSLFEKENILKLFDIFWEIREAHVYCKEDMRSEFSRLSRDIHPFCILSLYFYDKWESNEFDDDYLKRLVKNLDYIGISSTKNPSFSENHLHLGGAYPTEECILKIIDCERIKISKKSEIPFADRDLILFKDITSVSNIFGNCSRYLFYSDLFGATLEKEEIDRINFNFNSIKHIGTQSNILIKNCRLSYLKEIPKMNFLLREVIKNYRRNSNVSFFYFLMFLWSKIFAENRNLRDTLIALMLINMVNILRSNAVMSTSTGLEFFTKYFSSPLRHSKSPKSSFDCILNSGTKNLNFRTGIENPQNDIPYFANAINLAQKNFKAKNPDADVKINITYHLGKKDKRSAKNFLEAKKRLEIIKFCEKFIDFSGSCNSIIDEWQFNLNSYRNDRAKVNQILSSKNKGDRKVDLMKFVSAIDAAGNEESMPPEVYAPYLRKLAMLDSAQKKRANIIKNYPELKYLRKVFHSGEDFEDVATGLRRIDETVNFLSYNHNDRISHALALGVDPLKWYSEKGDVRITKINLLDNLVWLCHQARRINLPKMTSFIQRYEPYIVELASEIYTNFKPSELTQKNLYDAWYLRRNCPLKWQKVRNPQDAIIYHTDMHTPDIAHKFCKSKESIASQLFMYYNTELDSNFFIKANEFIDIRVESSSFKAFDNMRTISESDIDVIRTIQDFKINEYAERGIIIEACPSSNIYIGSFESTQQHPIYRWNPPVKDWIRTKFNGSGIRKNVINVCVNTDDPAIFPTNLENEFYLLRNGALELKDANDNIEEIDEWIEKLKRFNDKVFNDNYQNPFCNL